MDPNQPTQNNNIPEWFQQDINNQQAAQQAAKTGDAEKKKFVIIMGIVFVVLVGFMIFAAVNNHFSLNFTNR
jgi:hypothetical protein